MSHVLVKRGMCDFFVHISHPSAALAPTFSERIYQSKKVLRSRRTLEEQKRKMVEPPAEKTSRAGCPKVTLPQPIGHSTKPYLSLISITCCEAKTTDKCMRMKEAGVTKR